MSGAGSLRPFEANPTDCGVHPAVTYDLLIVNTSSLALAKIVLTL